MGTIKTRQLGVFMTADDEVAFFNALHTRLPAIRCIDVSQQTHTATPVYGTDISACAGRLVTLVDSDLVPESDFHARYVVRHPGGDHWIYAIVGRGLINLLRAAPANYAPDCLLNGELRATIPASDTETAALADIAFDTAAQAHKVYGLDLVNGETARRAERKLIAWPDAAARFNGSDGRYLTNHTEAWFVARAAGNRRH
ncbi:hypothetical protein [Achromobacter marplatensis]|uniref:hypothetical protein n=2 Tax=Achromobacter marplatensis TaxID=470868 RepID=UPI003C76A0F3